MSRGRNEQQQQSTQKQKMEEFIHGIDERLTKLAKELEESRNKLMMTDESKTTTTTEKTRRRRRRNQVELL